MVTNKFLLSEMKHVLNEMAREENLLRSMLTPGITIIGGRPEFNTSKLALRAAALMHESRQALYISIEKNKASICHEANRISRLLPEQLVVIDSPAVNSVDVMSLIDQKPKLSLVIVDYIGLLKEDTTIFCATLSRLNIPIILLSQLHRDADSGPVLEHIPDAQKVLSLASKVVLVGITPVGYSKTEEKWVETIL